MVQGWDGHGSIKHVAKSQCCLIFGGLERRPYLMSPAHRVSVNINFFILCTVSASDIVVQELRAIYLLEMTRCLTGIFGRGLPWDIQNRTS